MDVVVRLLAAYRITRLVAADKITEDVRTALQRRLPDKVAYLIGCSWCVSMYLVPPLMFAAAFWPRSRVVKAIVESLAGSAVAGLISTGLHVEEETAELVRNQAEHVKIQRELAASSAAQL